MSKENYNVPEVIKIIYEANRKGVLLWLQKDSLKFKAPENKDISAILTRLKEYKTEIIQLLKENGIYDEQFFQPYIYRLQTTKAPLSSNQERLWFIEQLENGTNAYHIPMVYELTASTQKKGIIHAIQQIVSRHTVLRTTIQQLENGAIQKIHDLPLPIEEVVLAAENELDAMLHEAINHPFDLTKEYPVRVKFYTLASTTKNKKEQTWLLINMHHIASDGWSIDIFKRQLIGFYEAYVSEKTFELPRLDLQYSDYAIWQKNYYKEELFENQLNYWKNKLQGYQSLNFPLDYNRPVKPDYKGQQIEFRLDKTTNRKLRELAQKHGVTLNSVMLASISILLGKYAGQDDIIIGSPVANRHHPQTEGTVGFFVNTQVNRVLLHESTCFNALIQQVHESHIESQDYQDFPFEKLVEALETERDPSRHPIFQVMFSVERFTNQNALSEKDQQHLKPYILKNAYEVEKFDLSITIDDSEEELVGQLSYATALFKREKITRLIEHYHHLLKQLVEAPGIRYSTFSLLTEQEQATIINKWNKTDTDEPVTHTLHELFEEQVKKTPDATALVFNNQQLTYRELNEKSNQLAQQLRKRYKSIYGQKLKADTFIALGVDRGFEMIVGTLAILKAGGAYVPMDISYSKDRVDYIVKDTDAAFVLVQKNNAIAAFLPADKLIYIDLSESIYETEDKVNLTPVNTVADLAYVIYTSGTTGQPKGVMVEHRSVFNEIRSQLKLIPLNQSDRSLLTANIIFDTAAECIYMALFTGSSLHIVDGISILDAAYIQNYIEQQQISVLNTTPSYLKGLGIDFKTQSLKHIILGGEAYQKIESAAKIYNTYGPTEAAIVTTACEVNTSETIHIGKPIENAKVYILDAYLQPVPVGVIGELYIGGAGLARGYLNRRELTEERFIPNPFATESDLKKGYTRLYKTGDTVKWLADGNIECIGRNDDQVKIRGYRIELGEIEHALSEILEIKQSCVIVKERSNAESVIKYIVAYYVLNAGEVLTQADIIEHLSGRLPEYMIPAAFVKIDAFPLTINGKLDKRALPVPNLDGEKAGYVQPSSELEIQLSEIYAGVLGLKPSDISTEQNFFRMGGNSILTIQLKQKISSLKEFSTITIADLFKYNSISRLIESIQQTAVTDYKVQNQVLQNHEVAIIGVSGAFSGANDVNEFWLLISEQLEGVKFHSAEACKTAGVSDAQLKDPLYIPVSAEIEGMDLFDPSFWNMSPNEARQLDPQIRKFVEHCWYALESAGYVKERKKHHIGIFAGSGANDYLNRYILQSDISDELNLWEVGNVNSKDALATKAAFLLGLTGPANSINTACSTGLVAVVEACQKLQLGVCDMALAGGVSLLMPDEVGYVYQEGMILSKDGHCSTFDERASGTTLGAGAGVVLLKSLQKAIQDNDPILGVIKGYATNNDGDRKTGYTAPSVVGQSECIIQAQRMAGITSEQVDYVECHGTATHLGDPIEIQALKEAFAFNKSPNVGRNHKTVLGAVKANIGHADSAAGIAGLIKICSMLRHDVLPAQVNFEKPNPELHLSQTPFEILKTNKEWRPENNRQRIAGVSSFGVGGTNAHLVIGDYRRTHAGNEAKLVKESGDKDYTIPLSAKNRKSLEKYKKELLAYLSAQPGLDIKDLAFTLQKKREHFNLRSAYTGRNIQELTEQLMLSDNLVETSPEQQKNIVFMFPGQGVQYKQMAKGLYESSAVFKKTLDHCISLANEYLPVDLKEILFSEKENSKINIHETRWTQISLFCIEYSLSVTLIESGIKSQGFIGHSIGEFVAATLSNVFTLKDAIRSVIKRGELMQEMESGSMLAVNAGEEAIKKDVELHGCEIAVINSFQDVVVSGRKEQIQSLKAVLEEAGVSTIILQTSHAYHSRSMEKAAEAYELFLKTINLSKPTHPFISNLTGSWAGEEVCSADYWSRQLRNTVQFAKGTVSIVNHFNGQLCLLEVGPGKGLSYFVNKHKSSNSLKYVQTVQLLSSEKELKSHEQTSYRSLDSLQVIRGKLWMNGLLEDPNPDTLLSEGVLAEGLPVYQFDYQRCWINKSSVSFNHDARKHLMQQFKHQVDQLSSITKEDAISLLGSLLTVKKSALKPEETASVLLLEDEYTETEYRLAQVVSTVLGIEQLSVHDDFFKIGGNSLSAIQASHRMSEVLKTEIKVADIFKYKSIRALAGNVVIEQVEGVEWEF